MQIGSIFTPIGPEYPRLVSDWLAPVMQNRMEGGGEIKSRIFPPQELHDSGKQGSFVNSFILCLLKGSQGRNRNSHEYIQKSLG